MATKTPNLNLVLPANNEFFNIWDQPLNSNLKIIDSVVGALQNEVITARGSFDSLGERIDTVVDISGNAVPSSEILAARVSTIYGGFNGANPFLLNDRLERGDREAFSARGSLAGLIDALAWDADQNRHNAVLSAASNPLTFTGAVVSLAGNVTPHISNINGYRQVVRTIKTTTISGAAGTYYLTLTRAAAGEQFINVVANTGTIGTYAANGLLAKLSDSSQNFVSLGVKPGDVLNITAPIGNPNIGQYIVLATNTEDGVNLTVNDIAVIGQFVNASSGLNYTINNPVAPTLGFTGTAHAKSFARVSTKIFIGRCVFDGTNVTSLTTYASLGTYTGFTSITLSSGFYSVTIPHNLGYVPSRVFIYASQASDFSQPLELLGPGDAAVSGQNFVAQMGDLTLQVKNPTSGLFYKDFGGSSQVSGFLYVVAER